MKNGMEKLISHLPQQILDAHTKLKKLPPLQSTPPEGIVFAGMGGSGMSALVVRAWLADICSIPVEVVNTYLLPSYITRRWLAVLCSYSGNTEETLSLAEQVKRRQIPYVVISSGGRLTHEYSAGALAYLPLPPGMPPRATIGYQLAYQVWIVAQALRDTAVEGLFEMLADWARQAPQKEQYLKNKAKHLAETLAGRYPVFYCEWRMEAVAVRWCQQIAENAKWLAWRAPLPEMNHNELVGWSQSHRAIVPVFLRFEGEHERVRLRIEFMKKHFTELGIDFEEVWAESGQRRDCFLCAGMNLLWLGDWLSWWWAKQRSVDPTPVDVIDRLKVFLNLQGK